MSTCYDSFSGRYYTCNSGWTSWGRWVVLGVIVVVAFLFFFLTACCNQRRRRARGRQPVYGTHWMGHLPYGSPPPYQPNSQYQTQPKYPTSAPQQETQPGGYYGQNQAYFGGAQTENIEMQRPANTYGAGENVYMPPAGPPPRK